MAYATQVTIGTSYKVSVDYQSQEVHISLTYQLERQDTDLLASVEAKAAEVEQAHRIVWRRIREKRAEQKPLSPPQTENPQESAASPPATQAANERPQDNGNGASPSHTSSIGTAATPCPSPSNRWRAWEPSPRRAQRHRRVWTDAQLGLL